MRWDRWAQAGLDDQLQGMTPVEFVLRFTFSHPDMDTTIVGTVNPSHLHANVAALRDGPLPPDLYAEAKRRLRRWPRAAGHVGSCADELQDPAAGTRCRPLFGPENPKLGCHRIAAMGVFGATAAAGMLIGLTAKQMLNAFGIAYSRAAGNRQCILDGALGRSRQRLRGGYCPKYRAATKFS